MLPDDLDLRLVRCSLPVKGFRTRQVILVTTLLDNTAYPPSALSELYLRRWHMELPLRHLKTTLQMEHLSCLNPDNVQRELRMHLLVHNLVRRIMLQVARLHRLALDRVSFAGALAACRRYAETMLQTTSKRKRQQLFAEMIEVIAADQLPHRLLSLRRSGALIGNLVQLRHHRACSDIRFFGHDRLFATHTSVP